MNRHFNGYEQHAFFDELLAAGDTPRPAAQALFNTLSGLTHTDLSERHRALEAAIDAMGITFTVYSEGQNIDRHWPLDIVRDGVFPADVLAGSKNFRRACCGVTPRHKTWAHYLHITDAMETARDFGLVAPRKSRGIDCEITRWGDLSQALNALSRSVGVTDPHPFAITLPVAPRLRPRS